VAEILHRKKETYSLSDYKLAKLNLGNCYSNIIKRIHHEIFLLFLDPVGSLVSTLWVVGGLLWVTLLSKLVNFECVGMLKCVGVLECVRVLEC